MYEIDWDNRALFIVKGSVSILLVIWIIVQIHVILVLSENREEHEDILLKKRFLTIEKVNAFDIGGNFIFIAWSLRLVCKLRYLLLSYIWHQHTKLSRTECFLHTHTKFFSSVFEISKKADKMHLSKEK